MALYVNNKTITYFDSFGVEHIPKEIIKLISNKKIITNIYRIEAYDSIMCGYFCIEFINFMFNGNNSEMKERKDIIKKISKYIVAFDYVDRPFITLSASFGTLSTASHATIVGIPVGIAGVSLTLIFTITTCS